MADATWNAAKVMAWLTWAASGLFAMASFLTNTPFGQTTLLGMVLCTLAILLACAAATQHALVELRSCWAKIQDAYELGIEAGRVQVEDEGLRSIQ